MKDVTSNQKIVLAACGIAIMTLIGAGIVYATHMTPDPISTVNDPITSSTAGPKQTTTPTPNAAPKANKAVAAPAPKSYAPPVCTDTPIPYKTTYENVTYLSPGQTTTFGGTDGKLTTCVYAAGLGLSPSTQRLNPLDKVVRVGVTASAPAPPPDTKISYQQAQMNCARFGGSSAYDQCMKAYGW